MSQCNPWSPSLGTEGLRTQPGLGPRQPWGHEVLGVSQEESIRTWPGIPSQVPTMLIPCPTCWQGPSPSLGDSSWITPHRPLTHGMRGSPDLGRDRENLQEPGQGILSTGGSYSLVQVWVAPWRCQKSKLRRGCPSSHGAPQGTWASQRCISPFPPWALQSQGGCEGLEGAAGSPLLTSNGCWAGVSYNQKRSQHSTVITEYKKNPKPGTRRRARPPNPRGAFHDRSMYSESSNSSNTREGEQRALTPKPAWGGDPGDPLGGAGLAGPGGSRSCRTHRTGRG